MNEKQISQLTEAAGNIAMRAAVAYLQKNNLKADAAAPRPKVVEAPEWLVQSMEALQRKPPPTLEQMDTQLKASAETRRKLMDRQRASSALPGGPTYLRCWLAQVERVFPVQY